MAVTITEQTFSSVKKIKFDWTLSTGGAASETTTKQYDGEILRVVFGPTNFASTGYAITINDEDGYDILEGGGAALTSGGGQLGVNDGRSPISAVAESTLTFSLTSTGVTATDAGTCVVYIR
jgi:hypothetical protein